MQKRLSLVVPTTSISLAVTEKLSKLWKETIITTFRNEACSLDLARAKAALIMECFVARLMDRLEVLGGTERQELLQQLQHACRNVDAMFYSALRSEAISALKACSTQTGRKNAKTSGSC